MSGIPEKIQKQIHKALSDMGPVFNACYKCKTQISMFAQEGIAQEGALKGKVICYFYSVGCESCKERGPESNEIDQATALWIGKHKLISGGYHGKKNR